MCLFAHDEPGRVRASVKAPLSALLSVLAARLTCSFMLLTPSGPSRLTACLTKSVRPQLSIRKPRSCRNFASAEAASSFLEAQKQSSVLKDKIQTQIQRAG